ncbi:hypothetical protein D3C84_989620 [compost metagenome]
MDKMFLVRDRVRRRRHARAAAAYFKQFAAAAVRTELERFEAASFRHLTKNDCACSVAEQNTGVAIRIIRNAGQTFCSYDERMLIHACSNHAGRRS